MSIRPPEYKPPPTRAYTDLGWACAALTGPATFVAAWIYCAVTWGFLFGFLLGWIPALILALLVAVATIYLWPLEAVALLYVIYRAFDSHPELPGLHRRARWNYRDRNGLVVARGSVRRGEIAANMAKLPNFLSRPSSIVHP